MRLPADVEEMRLIAEHHTARTTMRRMGWGSIIWGIINVGLGIGFTINLGPLNIVLVGIGLLLLFAGLWCLLAPGAEGVIVNGIGLILVGLWNIFVTILNTLAGAPPQVWWAVLGVFLIAAGVQCFIKYVRFSEALRDEVSPDEMAMMDDLVKTILKGDPETEPDIVAFSVKTFLHRKEWRGMLTRNFAVFYEKITKDVLVADPSQFNIKSGGKVRFGKSLNATVRINEHSWKAVISPASFDNFHDWKFGDDERERDGD